MKRKLSRDEAGMSEKNYLVSQHHLFMLLSVCRFCAGSANVEVLKEEATFLPTKQVITD